MSIALTVKLVYIERENLSLPADKEYLLGKDLCVIGRSEDSDYRIESKSVSKYHCVLVKTDGLILLRDLGSTNGTRVNGVRVRRAAILPNDQLAIANFRFLVKFEKASASDIPDSVIRNNHPDKY